MLDTVELTPPQKPTHAVIWLHGLGANGNDFVPLVESFSTRIKNCTLFIFPHAPLRAITVNQGMRMPAWYDIKSIDLQNKVDIESLVVSTAQIYLLINKVLMGGISSDHVFLGGFSQGGATALYAGLQYPQKLGGLISLSAYLPEAAHCIKKAHPCQQNTPIFIAHGHYDPVVPIHLGVDTATLLQKNRYSVTLRNYSMPHIVLPEEMADIENWLIQNMKI